MRAFRAMKVANEERARVRRAGLRKAFSCWERWEEDLLGGGDDGDDDDGASETRDGESRYHMIDEA